MAYTLYPFLAATEQDALPEYSTAMMYFVVPLTLVTLLIVLFRKYSAHHQPGAG
jgi:cation:H+ antiporter